MKFNQESNYSPLAQIFPNHSLGESVWFKKGFCDMPGKSAPYEPGVSEELYALNKDIREFWHDERDNTTPFRAIGQIGCGLSCSIRDLLDSCNLNYDEDAHQRVHWYIFMTLCAGLDSSPQCSYCSPCPKRLETWNWDEALLLELCFHSSSQVGGATTSETMVAEVINGDSTPFHLKDVILCFLPEGDASLTMPLMETKLIFEIMFISHSYRASLSQS